MREGGHRIQCSCDSSSRLRRAATLFVHQVDEGVLQEPIRTSYELSLARNPNSLRRICVHRKLTKEKLTTSAIPDEEGMELTVPTERILID